MPTLSDRSRLISIVQSRQNPRVRELRAAFARGAHNAPDAIAIEGERLLEEALRSHLRLRAVYLRSSPRRTEFLRLLDHLSLPASVPIIELTPPLFDSSVDTESPQGLAALVDPPQFTLDQALQGPRPLIVLAASLQDPGNFGTILRSAEAFGATGVLALPGTVSVWNPKTLRASAGSAFRLPVVPLRSSIALTALAERKIPIFAAVPAHSEDTVSCTAAHLAGPAALLIGNEGRGLSAGLLDHATTRIAIPTPGPVESLNAAIAASILLYEAARQRAAHGR